MNVFIQPTSNRIFVEVDDDIVVEDEYDTTMTGKVVEIGRQVAEVKVGDSVVFAEQAGQGISSGGKHYRILRPKHILGKF